MVASSQSLASHLHAELTAVRKERRVLDYRAAVLLGRIADEGLYRAFGHATVFQYAKIEHDLDARPARELLRVARKLAELPAIGAAFAAGDLDKSKVRELVRIATPDTEQAWLDRVKDAPSRVVEALVASAKPGDPPPADLPPPPLRPARSRYSVTMDTAGIETVYAAISDYRARMGVEGADLDEGEILVMLARDALQRAGSVDSPTMGEPYRLVIHHCDACGEVRAGDAEVSDTLVGEALCSSVITDMHDGPGQGRTTQSIPPAKRTSVLCKAGYRCQVPDCRNRAHIDIHHIRGRSIPKPHHPDNLVVLCGGHHRIVHAGDAGVERGADGRLIFHFRHGQRATHVGHGSEAPEYRTAGVARPTP